MKTIYKFPLFMDENRIAMDPNAKIVHVAIDNSMIRFWASLDTDAELKFRTFQVFGTGVSIPPGWEWVGTVIDGWDVWHVHEFKGTPA